MGAKKSKKGIARVSPEIPSPAIPNQSGSVSRRVEASVSALYEEYRGPIPSADELGKYEYICQGAARDIIEMAKEEQKMRASSNADEHKVHMQICANAARGQLYAFLTFLALIGSCCYVVHRGMESVARYAFAAIAAISAGAGIKVFMWKSSNRRDQRRGLRALKRIK